MNNNQVLSSRLPWIIAASLSFIIVLQAIAIIIILTNFVSQPSNDEADTGTTAHEDVTSTFDNEGNLVSFNAICTSNDGSYFKIFKSGNYEEYDNSSNMVSSGNYSMINGSVVSISPERTLYYEGYYLADGTTIYDCEADANTGTTE